jgi:MYXO-CTERM domain-containing protein
MLTMRIFSLFAVIITASWSHAAVIPYTDKAEWENAVGSFTTLDFTGGQTGQLFPLHTYAHLGVMFEGQQVVYVHSDGFHQDGEGIRANNHTLWAHFDEPQHAVAVDYPGQISIQLWFGSQHIYTTTFFDGGSRFAGLISEQPFDSVFLYRAFGPSTHVYIDDVHFGLPAVPAPGALALFGLGALALRRRRRLE